MDVAIYFLGADGRLFRHNGSDCDCLTSDLFAEPDASTTPARRASVEPAAPAAYIYRWDRHGRKGQPCAVICRGKMNSCLVQFEDGYTMVTSRNAIRKRKLSDG